VRPAGAQVFVMDKVPAVLEAVFQSTLDLITKNFEDYPDHRVSFYRLLRAVNAHCFIGAPREPTATTYAFTDACVCIVVVVVVPSVYVQR
jgi:hypothetical protein